MTSGTRHSIGFGMKFLVNINWRFCFKVFATNITMEWMFSCMHTNMVIPSHFLSKAFSTNITWKISPVCVYYSHMVTQSSWKSEMLSTLVTSEWLFFHGYMFMRFQLWSCGKTFFTFFTLMGSLSSPIWLLMWPINKPGKWKHFPQMTHSWGRIFGWTFLCILNAVLDLKFFLQMS